MNKSFIFLNFFVTLIPTPTQVISFNSFFPWLIVLVTQKLKYSSQTHISFVQCQRWIFCSAFHWPSHKTSNRRSVCLIRSGYCFELINFLIELSVFLRRDSSREHKTKFAAKTKKCSQTKIGFALISVQSQTHKSIIFHKWTLWNNIIASSFAWNSSTSPLSLPPSLQQQHQQKNQFCSLIELWFLYIIIIHYDLKASLTKSIMINWVINNKNCDAWHPKIAQPSVQTPHNLVCSALNSILVC